MPEDGNSNNDGWADWKAVVNEDVKSYGLTAEQAEAVWQIGMAAWLEYRKITDAKPGPIKTHTEKFAGVMQAIGAGSSPCKKCGTSMFWLITKNDKKMPVNADGTPHHMTCPHAGEFRKGG